MDPSLRTAFALPPALLACALACALAPWVATAQAVEHTFIVVVDGIRADEGFDEPGQVLLAPLVEELLPQGSLLSWMEIRGQSLTLPAHQVFVTGTYADCGNTPAMEDRTLLAPRVPTLFDSLRVHTGATTEQLWVVSNTPLVSDDMDHSLMPGWGPVLSASRIVDYGYTEPDAWVWEQIEGVLAQHEVDLMLVNLHETDRQGHSGSWEGYRDTVALAAEEIAAFWARLQADPVYQGNTLLLVATDHGRHRDDVLNGWVSHGCFCSGCRKAFLLALGPGVREDFVSGETCSFLDVAPTVAHLMGVPLPYHRGRVLTEILDDPAGVDPGLGGRYEPRLVASGDLMVRVSERHDPALADPQGAQQVVVELSDDGGESWTEHTTDTANALQHSPFAWTDGELVLVGWQELTVRGEEWSLRLRRLGPGSVDFEDVFARAMAGSGTPVSNAWIVAEDGDLWLAENNPSNERVRYWRSIDDGHTWSGDFRQYPFTRHFPRHVGQLDVDGAWVVAYSAHARFGEDPTDPNENTEIYVVRSDDQSETWEEEVPVSSDPSASIQPAMVLGEDGILHLVWADLAEGTFQLLYASSTDEGASFSTPVPLTDSAVGAWEPSLAADGERIYVAWSQFDAVDEATIHLAAIRDGALEDERGLSDPGRVARTPDLLPLGDCTSLVTWTESDLATPWVLAEARVTTAGHPASGATAALSPSEVPADGTVQELALAITLEVGPDDRGVDAVEVLCPESFPPDGGATVEIDGDAVETALDVGETSIRARWDTPVLEDGTLVTVRFDVQSPSEPVAAQVFEVRLRHGGESCLTEVEDGLLLDATAAGDDDDVSADDDDDSTDPGGDCDCRVGEGPRATVAVVALLLVGLVARRRI